MTVSSTTTKNSYAGDSSTVAFSYTFKIFDEDDIAVILRDNATATETVQTITTNYTVSGVGNAGGGTITFVTAPATGKTVVLRRESAQTQTTDYTPNDPFPAEAHEDALDKLTFFVQEVQEELDRSIKLSRTNTMTSTEFTVGAADRADKILAFDSNGEISVTQELGTFKGNWGTGTTYAVRDLVKDTSTNNIFIANTAHTSSGSQPLTTNTDSAKWDLLVDAASATTAASSATSSATAAAASASAASTSASNASTSETNAATSASNAATSATNAGNSATAASNAQAAAEAALDTFTDQYLGSLASDPTTDLDGNALTDGDLYFNTTDNVMKVYDLGNTTWKQLTPTAAQQTNIDTVSGIAANVTTVAGISGDVTTVSGNTANIGTVAGSISNVNTVGTNITSVVNAANSIASINNFGDTYFVSATAPSSPTLGDLWFDTTNDVMKVYGSGGFVNAGSSVNGTSNRYNYVVGTASGTYTGSTTVFPATYDAGYVDVYLNGAKLTVTSDFTATNGTDVTLATAATTSDVVDIVAYGTFTAATALSLGDNEKIQLGASQDLQIYHDGSNSIIDDTGSGRLYLRSDPGVIISKYTGETCAQFNADADVKLYYDNAVKLATTSTGVDVTGTVTATGNALLTGGNYYFGALAGTDRAYVGWATGNGMSVWNVQNSFIQFGTNNTERMRIDSSGNVLVGTTTADGGYDESDGGATTTFIGASIGGAASGTAFVSRRAAPLQLNRQANDGDIAVFRKDGTAVGSIGARTSGEAYIGLGSAGLTGSGSGGGSLLPTTGGTTYTDNVVDLGFSSGRFDDIYATNGTIQTSDANEKQQIATLTDAEITAAKAISALFKTFKWNSAVTEKGDAARTHAGVIAQDVQAAMTAAGLDAGDYAFFISSTWWETQTEVPAVEAVEAVDAVYEDVVIPAVEEELDEDGNVIVEAQPERTEQRLVSEAIEAVEAVAAYTRTDTYDTAEEAPEGAVERTRLGIRYPELLAFVGAATEQRLANIETRLTALENV